MRRFLWAIVVLSCFVVRPASGEEPIAKTGGPIDGESLFSGTTHFHNGGAPCLACHSISGLPGKGGTLGPDLTQTYSDYGEDAITTALQELPFPSMKPIYGTHPLTPEEQGHIKAFLRDSSEKGPARDRGVLVPFGIAGGLLGIGLAHVVWRKRLSEVRRSLLRRSAGPGGGGA